MERIFINRFTIPLQDGDGLATVGLLYSSILIRGNSAYFIFVAIGI